MFTKIISVINDLMCDFSVQLQILFIAFLIYLFVIYTLLFCIDMYVRFKLTFYADVMSKR